jgi:hypothetical protein
VAAHEEDLPAGVEATAEVTVPAMDKETVLFVTARIKQKIAHPIAESTHAMTPDKFNNAERAVTARALIGSTETPASTLGRTIKKIVPNKA